MTAATPVDLVKINVTSSGAGAFVLGTAVLGYRGIEALTNGGVYSYSIQQDGNYEFGRGTYLKPLGILVRTPFASSNGGQPVDFPTNAEVAFTFLGEDLLQLVAPPTAATDALSQEVTRATSAEATLAATVVASAAGWKPYATSQAMNADTTQPVGRIGYVYADTNATLNGIYEYQNSWVLATWFYQAIAGLVPSGTAATDPGVRDPFQATVQDVNRNTFGLVTYANTVRNIADQPILLLEGGNSHNTAQGASSIALSPVSQLQAKLQKYMPNRTINRDSVAVAGSWCNQIISSQLQPYIAANPSKTPRFFGFCTGANDGTANIFQAYQGFVGPGNTYGGYEQQLEGLLSFVRGTLDAIPIVFFDHYPHPSRSLANGRLTTTPEAWMQYPQVALYGGYVRMVFSKTDGRIYAYAVDVPFNLFQQYGSGTLGPGAYICQTRTDGFVGTFYKLSSVSSDGTYVTVDSSYELQNGALVKTANGVSADLDDGVTQVRGCNFDNETQVVPPQSQAIVQRDLGSGTPVSVSWRHYEIIDIARRVCARNAAVVVDWALIQGRLLTSDSVYDQQYSNGDDYHFPDAGYQLLASPLDRLALDIATGRDVGGLVYA